MGGIWQSIICSHRHPHKSLASLIILLKFNIFNSSQVDGVNSEKPRNCALEYKAKPLLPLGKINYQPFAFNEYHLKKTQLPNGCCNRVIETWNKWRHWWGGDFYHWNGVFILTRAEIHNNKEMVLVSGQLLKFLLCSTWANFFFNTMCAETAAVLLPKQKFIWPSSMLICLQIWPGPECYFFSYNLHVLSSYHLLK